MEAKKKAGLAKVDGLPSDRQLLIEAKEMEKKLSSIRLPTSSSSSASSSSSSRTASVDYEEGRNWMRTLIADLLASCRTRLRLKMASESHIREELPTIILTATSASDAIPRPSGIDGTCRQDADSE